MDIDFEKIRQYTLDQLAQEEEDKREAERQLDTYEALKRITPHTKHAGRIAGKMYFRLIVTYHIPGQPMVDEKFWKRTFQVWKKQKGKFELTEWFNVTLEASEAILSGAEYEEKTTGQQHIFVHHF